MSGWNISPNPGNNNVSPVDTYKLVRQIRKEIKKELAENKDKEKKDDKKPKTFTFWELVIIVWASSLFLGPVSYVIFNTFNKLLAAGLH